MSLYAFFLFLSLFGLFNGFFIAFILYYRPGKQNVLSKLIALLFFMGALGMLLITLVNANIIWEYPIIQVFEYFIGLGIGPLLLYCVQLFKKPVQTEWKKSIIHFVPAFTFLLLTIVNPSFELPILVLMLHFQIYIGFSVILFLNHSRSNSQKSPKKEQFWLTAILIFCVLTGFSQWIRFIFSSTPLLNLVIPLTASINFYLVLLLGFNRSIILPRAKQNSLKVTFKNLQKWTAVEQEILTRELYTKKGLTLNQMATHLEIPVHHFSALLHQEGAQHFPAYINTLRVNHAKRLLTDSNFAHYTIEAIAHQAGFQSRSAFYQSFKKHTGQTPFGYKTCCLNSNNSDNQH